MSKNKMNWGQLAKAWSKEFINGHQQQAQPKITAALQRTMPLLEDPTAVPFVCRYRTDVISPLTTAQIHQLSDMVETYKKLEALRNKLLANMPADDTELKRRVETSISKSELEALYEPYKPPSKGSLEDRIRKEHPELVSNIDSFWNDPESIPLKILQPREAALTLLANKIASHTATIDAVLEYVQRFARVHTSPNKAGMKDSTAKEQKEADQKYKTYYEFSSSFTYLKDHQVLAIRRGVQNKALKLSYDIDGDRVESRIRRSLLDENVVTQKTSYIPLWKEAIHDAWSRLLRKRCTNRLWKDKCSLAEHKSIQVFCDNLQKALLAPPLQPPRPVLALDPGFQAGIKTALLDCNGQLIGGTEQGLSTVKFLQNHKQGVQTLVELLERMKEHGKAKGKSVNIQETKQDAISVALGNGHGSQEARGVVREASKDANITIDIQLVNEAGASVWSVTEGAIREFPSEQPAAIAAVSIGRRFQNPLPELVKIPPRSLGLGMYQHDLSEKDLDEKLHLTSVNAVAEVGVDGNSCSLEILEKVPGLTRTLSQRILKARPIQTREDLLSRVSGLGPKTYENCAAFIKVQGGREPLDATLVHPESYKMARYLMKQLKWDLKDPSSIQTENLPRTKKERIEKWGCLLEKAAEKFKMPQDRVLSVINHLIVSVTNPDPRLGGEASELSIVGNFSSSDSTMATPTTTSANNINIGSTGRCSMLPAHLSTSMDDLRKACPYRDVIATIRNVVDFGAFVDFGAENDGLLHRSKLGPVSLSSLLVGQEIGVDILSVSPDNNRVSVALTGLNANPDPVRSNDLNPTASNRGKGRKGATAIQKRSYSSTSVSCSKSGEAEKSTKKDAKPKAKRRRVVKR